VEAAGSRSPRTRCNPRAMRIVRARAQPGHPAPSNARRC
jgi:hypothetical protein